MEITLTIPQNKWAKPTDVRQDVVQLICDTFLKGETWYSLYNAIVKSPYWDKMEFGNNENYGYKCSRKSEKIVKFHECEMRMAFTALQEAGWYFKAFYRHGSISHKCYTLSRENYEKTRDEYIVTNFTEQWD